MDKIKIKICGMKFPDNLKNCLELNPDFIGVIRYPKSLRYVENPEKLLLVVPNKIKKVAVEVNPELVELLKVQELGFDVIQFSGNESPEDLFNFKKEIKIPFVKAISSLEIDKIPEYLKVCSEIIIDNKTTGFGGTGQSFDWNLLKDIKTPYFLSGGLSLEKIEEIISFLQVNPNCIGLDLNSGFEIEPGNKSVDKLKDFIKRVHDLRS